MQEVVDRSRQSLRSFYLQFDGKHELLLALFTELMEEAADAGVLREGIDTRRMAAMTMQTVMFVAQSSGGADGTGPYPITADEVWEFCAQGFAAE